jgi:hypothetical protein
MKVAQTEKNKGISFIVNLNFDSTIAIHSGLVAVICFIRGLQPAYWRSTAQQQYYNPSISSLLIHQFPISCRMTFNPAGIDHDFGSRYDALLNARFGNK